MYISYDCGRTFEKATALVGLVVGGGRIRVITQLFSRNFEDPADRNRNAAIINIGNR